MEEITDVRQRPEEGFRRYFIHPHNSGIAQLWVWYATQGGPVVGFEIVLNETFVITWTLHDGKETFSSKFSELLGDNNCVRLGWFKIIVDEVRGLEHGLVDLIIRVLMKHICKKPDQEQEYLEFIAKLKQELGVGD
jgi:hypothetical protein